MQIWAERTLVRHHKPTKMAPPQVQKAKGAHHCPKIRKNATKHHHHCPKIRENITNHSKNDKLMYKIRKNAPETLQKRQLDVQNWPKEIPKFLKSLSKQELRISLNSTLSFFQGKSDSKKGGGSQ